MYGEQVAHCYFRTHLDSVTRKLINIENEDDLLVIGDNDGDADDTSVMIVIVLHLIYSKQHCTISQNMLNHESYSHYCSLHL